MLAALAAAYLLTGPLWRGERARRIGEEPSSTPGYSILVGLNPESGGRWNQADSDALFAASGRPGATAQQTQEEMLDAARARLSSGEVPLLSLARDKLRTLLGSDNACVGYSAAVLRHRREFSLACNGFFYGTLLLAAGSVVGLWRQGCRSAVLLLPLCVLGLTLAQMLVEVAGRYHYALLPLLFLLAECGSGGGLLKKFQKTRENP